MLAFAALSLNLCACAGVQTVTAAPPKSEAFRTELKKELSIINVPFEATAAEVAKTLNQTVRNELYKGSTSTKGVSAVISRNGQIAVNAADDFIYLTLPISMTLSYSAFKAPAIPLKLRFKMNARITADWKLVPEIYYLGLSDLLAEDVGIGPVSFKPRAIAEGVTQPVQKVISEMLGKKINELFPLKAQVTPIWNAAQKPVHLDKKYNAWLVMTPKEVMLNPLEARGDRIRLSVGINTFAEVVVGPQPAARPPLPLPNLKLVSGMDRHFRVALNADLYYRDIVSIAAPLLLNRELGKDGKSLIVKELDIYGNGDRLVVKVQTSGSLDGIIYLTARPRFNPQTNLFTVDEVDFDMQTESTLMKSADWLLHGTFKSIIQEKLNMDLTQRIAQSKELAQKALAQVNLTEHVVLQGTIKTLMVSDAVVQKDRLAIQLFSDGETAVRLR
jgi:hypothetical protein